MVTEVVLNGILLFDWQISHLREGKNSLHSVKGSSHPKFQMIFKPITGFYKYWKISTQHGCFKWKEYESSSADKEYG